MLNVRIEIGGGGRKNRKIAKACLAAALRTPDEADHFRRARVRRRHVRAALLLIALIAWCLFVPLSLDSVASVQEPLLSTR